MGTSSSSAFETFCKENGHRYTKPRSVVYEIIQKSDKALGAYEILDLSAKPLNNPKPPTIYRALEFLQKHGFIHRIESLNAYVSCSAGHHHKGSQFMICSSCGRVQEAHMCHPPEDLVGKISDKGFSLSHWNAELHGLCSQCQ